VLNRTIDSRLLSQEAVRIGLDEQPAFQLEIADYERNLLARLLIKREVDAKSTVDEVDVKAAWEQTNVIVKARHVTTATEEAAEAVRAKMLAGEDPAALARQYSIAPSSKRDGLVSFGWGADEGWDKYALGLKAGEVSVVFRSAYGWDVVKAEERFDVEKRPFDIAGPTIKKLLETRKTLARKAAFLDEMHVKHSAQVLDCDLSLASLQKALKTPNDAKCATWDGKALTVSGLASRLDLEVAAKLPPDDLKEALRSTLQDQVDREMLAAEAVSRGYDKEPEVVAEVRTRREFLLRNDLLNRYVFVKTEASEAEIATYIAENASQLMVPEKRQISQFAVRTKEAAAAARKELDEGRDFDGVMEDADAIQGTGATVWVSKGDLPPEADPVFAAKIGQVVGPVASKGGYFLVKVLAVTPETMLDPATAREKARLRIIENKSAKAYDDWTKKLRSVSDIEINEAGIRAYIAANPESSVLKPPPATPEAK